jgi:hypothetical protein
MGLNFGLELEITGSYSQGHIPGSHISPPKDILYFLAILWHVEPIKAISMPF